MFSCPIEEVSLHPFSELEFHWPSLWRKSSALQRHLMCFVTLSLPLLSMGCHFTGGDSEGCVCLLCASENTGLKCSVYCCIPTSHCLCPQSLVSRC